MLCVVLTSLMNTVTYRIKCLFWFMVPEGCVHYGGEAGLGTGAESWELISLITSKRQKEWAGSASKISSQSSFPMMSFLHQGCTTFTFPNDITNWGPSIKKLETMGDMSHSNHWITYIRKINLWYSSRKTVLLVSCAGSLHIPRVKKQL